MTWRRFIVFVYMWKCVTIKIIPRIISIFDGDFSHISFLFACFFVHLQFDNVNNCLNTLHTIAVGGLNGITTKDICAGNTLTIFNLFYALSLHKQAVKQKSGVSINSKQQQAPQAASAQTATQPIHQPLAQQQQQQQSNTVNASNEMLNSR